VGVAQESRFSRVGISRYISGKPNTGEDVWSRLLRYVGHWQLIGYGYWIVETLDQNTYLGEFGFGDFRRGITPNIDAIPEIGWVLSPHAPGQGFASEAATAALAWRDAHLPEGPTSCLISPDNAPSLKLAAKLGFTQISLSSHRDKPTVVLMRETP